MVSALANGKRNEHNETGYTMETRANDISRTLALAVTRDYLRGIGSYARLQFALRYCEDTAYAKRLGALAERHNATIRNPWSFVAWVFIHGA
jgi:hypothetical protein